ncbi:hypothetical protein AB205_0022260 [Aquarana catesbeiana]|uniref:Uncharacterized protein n=1 Tax=Aquarana catesbeiana TaxID=8400 RepID=A0A2G9RSY0_AQUCT|nr:hypothetical protein AB205_0022260 [Aquarana catesbeiana]
MTIQGSTEETMVRPQIEGAGSVQKDQESSAKKGKKTRDVRGHQGPQPPKEGEIPKPQPEDVEEGEVYEVGEIVTTTGDVDVVEEETHFTSASAHFLNGEIMVCNQD